MFSVPGYPRPLSGRASDSAGDDGAPCVDCVDLGCGVLWAIPVSFVQPWLLKFVLIGLI